MSVFQETLKNKTVLITEPMENATSASIGFWFSVGSRYEKEGERGISHFVEHLLFKGTKTRSAFDIACGFDYIGSLVNAFTDREAVCIHCTVPADKVDFALEVFCDMTENSMFNIEDVEKERSVIESEIISSEDDPEEAANDEVCEIFWPNQSLSQCIAGKVEDISLLTREHLYAWYEKYIKKGKLTVCVVGKINLPSIINRLEKLSTRLEQNEANGRFDTIFPKPQVFRGVTFYKAAFQQEQVFVLFPVDNFISFHEQCSWNVFNAIVGDTMSSRLFQRLRENGGFCYNVYSSFNMHSDVGSWYAYASSNKKDIVEVIAQLIEEIVKLKTYGITETELAGAKEHLCGEEIISSEDTENRSRRLIREYIHNYKHCTTEEIISEIRSITKNDVENVIAKILDFSKMAVVIYGPKVNGKSRKMIEKSLSMW